jgi:hypothetical protein
MKISHNFKPYPLQREVLKAIHSDNGIKYITISTGRQVGKSLMGTYCSLNWLLTLPDSQIGYITPVFSQGKKIFNSLTKMLKRASIEVDVNKTGLEAKFRNGSSETSLKFFSADGYDSIRGNTFDRLIMDEAAFIKDEAWNEAIKPTTMVKCRKVVFLSTPKKTKWFKSMFDLGDGSNPRYKSFTFPSHANPYISQEELDEFKLTLPPNVYRQEILGQFLESGSEVFEDLTLIATPVKVSLINPTDKFYAGVDVAQSNDYTVVTVIDANGTVRYIDRFNKLTYALTAERIDKVLKSFPNLRASIEVNSIGQPLYEAINNLRNAKYKIDRFTTTNDSKSSIVSKLVKSIQEGELRVSEGVEALDILVDELSTFGFEYSHSTKKIKYGATGSFHDDTVMSLAIANSVRLDNILTGKGIAVVGAGQRVY